VTLPTSPPAPASRRELRVFAFTVGGALVALALVAAWRGLVYSAKIAAVLGASLAAMGVAAPQRLGGVHRRWMALAHAMSRVTTPVFMAIVYFGVLTPLALVLRTVRRRGPRRPETLWVRRDPDARRSDLRRQF
jgi:hypothetical protein